MTNFSVVGRETVDLVMLYCVHNIATLLSCYYFLSNLHRRVEKRLAGKRKRNGNDGIGRKHGKRRRKWHLSMFKFWS